VSGVISGDPERLVVFGAEVRRLGGPLAGGVEDYRGARVALLAAPSELGLPPVEDLAEGVEGREEDLLRLGRLVDAFAEALCAADTAASEGVRRVEPEQREAFLLDLARRVGAGGQALAEADGRRGVAIHASRSSVHLSRLVMTQQRLYFLHKEYWTPLEFFPDARAYDRALAGHRATLAPRIAALEGRSSALLQALRRSEPVTGVGRYIDSAGSGPGRYLRYGGRALGGLGAAYSAVEAIKRSRDGDTWGAARSAAMAVGGGAMLFPPVAAVGALVVAGVMLYEHRQQVADAGRWVAGRMESASRSPGEGLSAAGTASPGFLGGLSQP
jgi:hypothetical protein